MNMIILTSIIYLCRLSSMTIQIIHNFLNLVRFHFWHSFQKTANISYVAIIKFKCRNKICLLELEKNKLNFQFLYKNPDESKFTCMQQTQITANANNFMILSFLYELVEVRTLNGISKSSAI